MFSGHRAEFSMCGHVKKSSQREKRNVKIQIAIALKQEDIIENK
jgi:hypothetical protein